MAFDPAHATRSREEAEASPLRCPDPDAEARMVARIDEARSNGDTVGGVFEVVAHGVPIGLGSYVHWDRRLDAALAAAVMSINIVKGVEIGLGFEQTRRFGSAVHDVIEGRGEAGRWVHRSNNAGGLTGGVSNGEPIVVRGAVKPISTLARPLPSADLISGQPVEKAHYERSDISVVPAAGVIGEAMVMLTLADFALDKFGGDSLAETRDNLARYRERISQAPEAPVPVGRRDRGRRHGVGAARNCAPGPKSAPAATTERPRSLKRRPTPWTSSSSACRAAARASSASGSPSATRRAFIDLDEVIEREAGRSIPDIFAIEGEAEFRRRERAAVAGLGPPSPETRLRRVIATGGGTVVDPRNRWLLLRGRVPRLARRPARGPRAASAPQPQRPAADRGP